MAHGLRVAVATRTMPGLGSCLHPMPKQSCQVASGQRARCRRAATSRARQGPGDPEGPALPWTALEGPGLPRTQPDVAARHTWGVRLHSDGVTGDGASFERDRTGMGITGVQSAASHRLHGDRDHGHDEDHADQEESGYPDDGQHGGDHRDNLVPSARRLLEAPRLRLGLQVAVVDPDVRAADAGGVGAAVGTEGGWVWLRGNCVECRGGRQC